MRVTYFVMALLLALILALWGLARMVIQSDPAEAGNVAIVLGLLFMVAWAGVSLVSWGVVRRLWAENRFGMALRHGVWAGCFLVMLPVLRWLGALSVLSLGAVLLILFGLESMVLLQQEPEEPRARRIEEP